MAVYFVKAKGTNRVKIGYTASNDPKSRINQLKTSCADTLELVQFYPDAPREVEKKFHDRFKSSHIKREWFYYRPEISEFLGDCNLDKPEIQSAPDHIIALQDKIDVAHYRITEQSVNQAINGQHASLLYMALKYAILSGEEDVYHFFDCARETIGDLAVLSREEIDFIQRKRKARARRQVCGSRRAQ